MKNLILTIRTQKKRILLHQMIIVLALGLLACSKRNFTAKDFTSDLITMINDYDVSSDFSYNLWGAIDGRRYYQDGKLAVEILVYATQNPQEEMRKLPFTQHIVVLDIQDELSLSRAVLGRLKNFEVIKNRNLVLTVSDLDAVIALNELK